MARILKSSNYLDNTDLNICQLGDRGIQYTLYIQRQMRIRPLRKWYSAFEGQTILIWPDSQLHRSYLMGNTSTAPSAMADREARRYSWYEAKYGIRPRYRCLSRPKALKAPVMAAWLDLSENRWNTQSLSCSLNTPWWPLSLFLDSLRHFSKCSMIKPVTELDFLSLNSVYWDARMRQDRRGFLQDSKYFTRTAWNSVLLLTLHCLSLELHLIVSASIVRSMVCGMGGSATKGTAEGSMLAWPAANPTPPCCCPLQFTCKGTYDYTWLIYFCMYLFLRNIYWTAKELVFGMFKRILFFVVSGSSKES